MVGITTALKRFFQHKKSNPKVPITTPDSVLSASSSTPMLEWQAQAAARLLNPTPGRVSPPPFLTLPRRAAPVLTPDSEDQEADARARVDPPSSRRVSTNTFRTHRMSRNRRFDGKGLAERSLVPTKTFGTPCPKATDCEHGPHDLAHPSSVDGVCSAGADSQFRQDYATVSAFLVLCEKSTDSFDSIATMDRRGQNRTSYPHSSPLSSTALKRVMNSSLCPPSPASRPSTPIRNNPGAGSGACDPLLIAAYATTIPNGAPSHEDADAPPTPKRRPIAGINFIWSPTTTPERPGTPFADMEFEEYVSRALGSPPHRPHNFCRNMEPAETFITRTRCRGAGAREFVPDVEANPQVGEQVDAVFRQVLRQRVLSRQHRCPVSLYDLMEVDGSPTARPGARALRRTETFARAEEGEGTEEVEVKVNYEAAERSPEGGGQVNEESLGDITEDSEGSCEGYGSIAQERVCSVLQPGHKSWQHAISDPTEHLDAVYPEESERLPAADASATSDDDEAPVWYENRNQWLGGVPDV